MAIICDVLIWRYFSVASLDLLCTVNLDIFLAGKTFNQDGFGLNACKVLYIILIPASIQLYASSGIGCCVISSLHEVYERYDMRLRIMLLHLQAEVSVGT